MSPSIEPEKKLVWLGLKTRSRDRSVVADEVRTLKKNTSGWSEYETAVSNAVDHGEHEDWLTSDGGFTSSEASGFTEKIKGAYSDWSSYQSFVVDTAGSYGALLNGFGITPGLSSGRNTEGGSPVAGIRIHEQDGATVEGKPVPAGTVEIFGREVHTSQTGQVATAEPSFSYSNLRTDPQYPDYQDFVDVRVDVTNNGGAEGVAHPQLLIDGAVHAERNVPVQPNDTLTVEFSWTADEPGLFTLEAGDAQPIEVRVNFSTGDIY